VVLDCNGHVSYFVLICSKLFQFKLLGVYSVKISIIVQTTFSERGGIFLVTKQLENLKSSLKMIA
jgi:hypothetical protein